MKKYLIGLMTLLASSQAFAMTAKLDAQVLQPGGYLASIPNYGGADIEVNLQNRELTLTIYRKFFCPKGQMCPMVMPAPQRLTVPLASERRAPCGVTIFQGADNKAMVDGMNLEITVADNSGFSCESFAKVNPVEVTVKMLLPRHSTPETDFLIGSESLK